MSTPDPYTDSARGNDGESPFRNRWFIASAGFLVAIALLAVLVIATTGGKDTKASAGGSGDPAPAQTSAPAAPSSGTANGCPAFADSSRELPTAAPAGITWQLFRTVALPSSQTSGPAVVQGDVARCYAHTPTGALLAAAQISTRSMVGEDWKTVMNKQTYGDAKAAAITSREKAEKVSAAPAPEPGELGQFAGFRFVTYDNDKAVVELVSRFSEPVSVLQVSTATVRWQDDDWRLEVSAAYAGLKSVKSLAGYTQWGGV